jgi:hypothetical protein
LRVAVREAHEKWSHYRERKLKNLFLAAEVAEGADVGDGEGDAELVFRAHLAEDDAAVFEREATAVSVVGDLHDLVLQGAVLKVVAYAASEIKTFAVKAAVADQCANLI